MSDPRDVDPRLHAYLDGELSAEEAAQFDGELRPGSIPRNQFETLMHLGAWFRATRPRAPETLARSVELALRLEQGASRTPATKPGIFRWLWAPAAAVAALALLVFLPHRPTSERDQAAHSDTQTTPIPPPSPLPPPVIQTSRAVETGARGPNTVRYVFTVKADQVREICLAGDFNQWKVCDAPLLRVGEGVWSITIDLPRGRHEYMFVIDGRWVTDPNAMGYSRDGFGNRNALLVV